MIRTIPFLLAALLAISSPAYPQVPNGSGMGVPNAAGGGAPSGTATGDLSGTYPNPTVSKIGGIANVAPTTWTPTDASGAALSFTAVSANYTKIGNMVFAYASLTYPATASGSNATIGGFPVTIPNVQYALGGCSVYSNAAGSQVKNLLLTANSTSGVLTGPNGGVLTNTNMSGALLYITCTYPAS